MMGIPAENVFEFIDSDYDTIRNFEKKFARNIIVSSVEKGEKVFIYAYVAGHGVADVF